MSVVIKNTGAGLSPKEHRRIQLTIKSKSRSLQKQWPLSKVDPKRKLSKPKMRVVFNTGIKLKKPEKFVAKLFKGKWKSVKQARLAMSKPKSLKKKSETKSKDLKKHAVGLPPKKEGLKERKREPGTVPRLYSRRKDTPRPRLERREPSDGPPEFSPVV